MGPLLGTRSPWGSRVKYQEKSMSSQEIRRSFFKDQDRVENHALEFEHRTYIYMYIYTYLSIYLPSYLSIYLSLYFFSWSIAIDSELFIIVSQRLCNL